MKAIRSKYVNQLDGLFHPKGNIAFFDAEFNAGMDNRSGEKICEIISVGMVICDAEYHGIQKFYTLVSPISKVPVFPLIREMTGITTDMLEGQPSFAEMSAKVMELLNKYEVKKIYAWGAADKHSLLSEKAEYRKKRRSGYQQANKWTYMDMCTDISQDVSSKMLGIRGGLAINMENLMFLCSIDKKQEHNALSDANDLYRCCKFLRKHYPLDDQDVDFSKKRELVNRYYQERSTYNSFRRFKATSKGADLYGKLGKKSKEEDIRLKAFEDDIRFLKGEIPFDTEFDSIQEYFRKRTKEKDI